MHATTTTTHLARPSRRRRGVAAAGGLDRLPRTGRRGSGATAASNFLPLFGEGNWIVVSETAFPLLSKSGIETVPVRESLADAVNQVAGLLQSNNRLRGVYHLPSELDVVAAGGGEAEAYVGALRQILPESAIEKAPSAEILARLLDAAEVGRVLVIKTDSEIPYGTVAIELKRGYWSDEQEAELRKALEAAGG
jgi:hypothetical protein